MHSVPNCQLRTKWHKHNVIHFLTPVIHFLLAVFSSPLSLLQAGLDPSGEGSATWVFRLRSALFSTSIKSTRKSSMLYFTTSIHLFSVFLYSVVRLPRRFSRHNPPLLGVVHAQTISTWPLAVFSSPTLCIYQWLLSLYPISTACTQWKIGGEVLFRVLIKTFPLFHCAIHILKQTDTGLFFISPYF